VREITADEAIELSFGRVLSKGASDEVTAAMMQGQLVALLRNRDAAARPIAVFATKS
jgi:tRNA pseudouridine55 synthase